MDFELGEKAEKLRAEVRKFALTEVAGKPYRTAMLEEESEDEDWEFSLSISKNWRKKAGCV
jgi:hypothetical protein